MDEQVIAAMAKWPNVPAVYGWLSLTEAGQWRLHPGGDALLFPDSPGETITSPQILAFIDRNYAADEDGQWYFQNGPQRVYVRLAQAPFILHTTNDPASGLLKLRTHTGLDVREVLALYLDEAGRLFLSTDRGPALLAGRDLPALLEALEGGTEALADSLTPDTTTMIRTTKIHGFPDGDLALHSCSESALESRLNFRRLPVPPQQPTASPPPISGPKSD